jgi:uncharacterized protein YuzE
MRITYDDDADALYIKLADGSFHENQKFGQDTVLDVDEKGKVLGIEVLGVKDRFGKSGHLKLEFVVQGGMRVRPDIEELDIPLSG